MKPKLSAPEELEYRQAVALRQHQLQGFYVDPQALAHAIEVIQRTRTTTPRPPSLKRIPVPDAQNPDGVDIDAVHRLREPWPLLTAENEAQVMDASRNTWARIGSDE